MATIDGAFAGGTVDAATLGEVPFRGKDGIVANFNQFIVDRTPPIVTLISPSAGSRIAPLDVITFEVTDNINLLRRIVVGVRMGDGTTPEVITYDGVSIEPGFSGQITGITNGFRFNNVGRVGGWRQFPVRLRVIAYDTDGNEA